MGEEASVGPAHALLPERLAHALQLRQVDGQVVGVALQQVGKRERLWRRRRWA
jgi:hypothetical protein